MAVWQFVLDFIPLTHSQVNGVKAARVSPKQLDEIKVMFPPSVAGLFCERVGKLLPEGRFRSEDFREWGCNETDDIQIHLDGLFIEYVQYRLNVANIDVDLLDGVCALTRDFGCVFASREGAVIRPVRDSVLRAALRSDAAKFVSDPDSFFRKLIADDTEGELS